MYSAPTDGGSSSVEQTGNINKSTRVLIPDQTGCCYLCATAHLPARGEKQPSAAKRLKVQRHRQQSPPFPPTEANLVGASGRLRIPQDHVHWGLRCSCRSVRNLEILFCRRNVRSSSLCKVESSALISHGRARRGTWMSAKEPDRLKVLHEVKKRHISQKQAGAELGLSVRWIRELLMRVRKRGDKELRHGLKGRASNRKTPEGVKRRVVELFRKKKQPSCGMTTVPR